MELEQLEGSVENVIYYNKENGYTIFNLAIENELNITCTAYTEGLSVGENLKVEGQFSNHSTYGRQLNIKKYEKHIPNTLSGIERYLASGAIKGIGPKYASSIVKKFGENTLQIIEKEPNRLAEIKGISLAKAENISLLFREQEELRKIILTFSEFGISTSYAMKIYKRYRGHSIDIIKENPYVLSSDIIGIGFKIADKIALNIGILPNSLARIKAGIKYIISKSVNDGDVAIEKEQLLKKTEDILFIQISEIENGLVELQIEKEIIGEKINEKIYIYQNFFFYAENYVAKKLLELSFYKVVNYEPKSKFYENLAELQKKAVKESLKSGLLVITGGPGTGKTTTLKAILQTYEKLGITFELASPTGRAAKRMSEATGYEAKTIHRLLGIQFLEENKSRQSFEKDEENPIETDAIIIDEASMIDLTLMYHLLKAIKLGTILILVGDSNQLPSVGAGDILRDIINSGQIVTVSLKEIFRQAEESLIVKNAHKINNGELPDINQKDKDFFFIRKQSVEEVEKTIIDLCTNRLPGYLGIKKEDLQVLSPMRKGGIGTINLNNSLQQALNPEHELKQEVQSGQTTFRTGDRVMQIKNNYQLEWNIENEKGEGIFNGDEGKIIKVDKENEKLKVKFYDNKIIEYDFSNLDELALSYAITIHKSQGSEYDAVIMPIHSGPPMLLTRNLLYTGLTRAKKLAVFVGTESML
ncbi:MAG: ATP-dependent RecD-like DNA helicase, partial [Defluviitaleaceae bacterium]|nr:ATP-dependent RecD-like DNA helicase [Defluviitaleaceae bacterium]